MDDVINSNLQGLYVAGKEYTAVIDALDTAKRELLVWMRNHVPEDMELPNRCKFLQHTDLVIPFEGDLVILSMSQPLNYVGAQAFDSILSDGFLEKLEKKFAEESAKFKRSAESVSSFLSERK